MSKRFKAEGVRVVRMAPGIRGVLDVPRDMAFCVDEETAARIAATLDACEGIPTEELEYGVVGEMLALLEQVDVVMDGAAIAGVARVLAPQYQADWARVHMAVQDLLDKVRGDQS